jgi:protein-disulfide isomerase
VLETEPKIVANYVNKGIVKLIFRHVLDFGAASEIASQAAECAGDQGKFWVMHHELYAHQNDLWAADPNVVKKLAQTIKLDATQFNGCMDTKKYAAKVKAQDTARRAAGIRVRPTFELNGQRIQGALDFATFQSLIERALK